MLMLRLIPTTDTATPDLAATEDTEAMVSATAVDTPPLDTPDLDTLVLATAVATPDLDMEVTTASVRLESTASVRLRPSLRLMLMLRLIPTMDTATPDLATLASGATEDMVLATAVDTPASDTLDLATAVATLDSATDTAVATDTSDKKDPVLQSTKAFKTSAKQNDNS